MKKDESKDASISNLNHERRKSCSPWGEDLSHCSKSAGPSRRAARRSNLPQARRRTWTNQVPWPSLSQERVKDFVPDKTGDGPGHQRAQQARVQTHRAWPTHGFDEMHTRIFEKVFKTKLKKKPAPNRRELCLLLLLLPAQRAHTGNLSSKD